MPASLFRRRSWHAAPLLLPALLCAGLGQISVCRAEDESLDDAFSIAASRDPGLIAQKSALRVVDEEIPRALAEKRPTVELEAGKSFRHANSSSFPNGLDLSPGTVNLTVTQPLYHGDHAAALQDKANDDIEGSRSLLVATEETILYRVFTDYSEAIAATELGVLLRRYEADLVKWRAKVAEWQRVGQLAGPDLDEADGALARARALVEAANGRLQSALTALQRDTGERAQSLRPIPDLKNLPSSREQAQAWAERENPTIIAATHAQRAAENARQAVASQFLPKLDLLANVGRVAADFIPSVNRGVEHDEVSVGLRLNWSLYDGGLRNADYRSATQSISQRRAEADDARAAAIQQAGTAWDEIDAARREIPAYQAQVDAQKRSLAGIIELDAIVARTPHEVLLGYQLVLDSEIALLNAKVAEKTAQYKMALAMGRLTVQGLALAAEPAEGNDYLPLVRNRWWGHPTDVEMAGHTLPVSAPINQVAATVETPPILLREVAAVSADRPADIGTAAQPAPEPAAETVPGPTRTRREERAEVRSKWMEYGNDE